MRYITCSLPWTPLSNISLTWVEDWLLPKVSFLPPCASTVPGLPRMSGHIQVQIPVVGNLRDLGSALSFAMARCTSYSRARLFQAIATVLRIGTLPHPKDVKARFIISSGHSRGLYGCPSSQVDIDTLAKYTAAILDTIGPGRNKNRSRSLTFGTLDISPYIDPCIDIFHDRVASFRRFAAIFPEKQVLIENIYTYMRHILQSHMWVFFPTAVICKHYALRHYLEPVAEQLMILFLLQQDPWAFFFTTPICSVLLLTSNVVLSAPTIALTFATWRCPTSS